MVADPDAQAEERRQIQQHRILREVFDGVVIPPIRFPPSGVDEPAVLDCGFGKGAWIDDLLSEYEDAVVTGIDMFLGRGTNGDEQDEGEDEGGDNGGGVMEFEPKRWNLNAPFRQDRSDSRLQPGTFDLINSRFLVAGINGNRWATYIADLERLLKPGGWVQIVEQYPLIRSESGRAIPYLQEWWQRYSLSMVQMNKDPHISRNLRAQLDRQGFENVRERVERLPIGNWDAGQSPFSPFDLQSSDSLVEHASLGEEILDNVEALLVSLSLYPFLHPSRPSMTGDEYLALIQGARRELRMPDSRLYYHV